MIKGINGEIKRFMENMQARMSHSAPEEPEQFEERRDVKAEPTRTMYRSDAPSRRSRLEIKSKHPKKRLIIIAAIVAVLIIGGIGAVLWGTAGQRDTGINPDEYQAVFLANNTLASNVYFGKLERLPDGYYKLSHVYYLRQSDATTTSNSQTNVTLTKLTTQIHGPEDSLILPREQILYYQNMRSDSKVVQAIEQDTTK